MALIRLGLVVSILQTSFALFSQTTHWTGLTIQKNSQGAWCFLPWAAYPVRTVACTGSSSDFATVLDVHLNQGLSIAYYNGIDNTLLGGANYSLPVEANMPIIRLCVSGLAGDGYYYETICTNAVADNVWENSPACQVALGQKAVTDGCYDPSKVRTGGGTGTSTEGAMCTCTGVSGGSSYMSGESSYISRDLAKLVHILAVVVMVGTVLQL